MNLQILRARLKANPLLYRLVYYLRRGRLNRRIACEQRWFERQAAARGLPTGEESSQTVFSRLKQRLRGRGVNWPPLPSHRPLHILYASVPSNWERHNLPPELSRLGEITCFFLEDEGIPWRAGWEHARALVDQKLPEFVRALHQRKPIDFMLSYLTGAQISPAAIEAVAGLGIPTFSFHLDDRRAFYGRKIGGQWSGPAAVCTSYDLNLSNALTSLVKYRVLGANVLFWPEGANADFFRPLALAQKYEVSFCGQHYGVRPLLVDYLRKHGVQVDCFGEGWEHGYVSDLEMVTIFNQSRVNLGFGYVNESTDQCLKARDFEVPACSAVYLTSYNNNLHRIYCLGDEIETYDNFADCLQKARALLADENRCQRMRAAAREAVLHRHTWAARVRQLLECSDCPQPIADRPRRFQTPHNGVSVKQ